jgi:hypothetical protein
MTDDSPDGQPLQTARQRDNRWREKSNLSRRIKLIWVVQMFAEKYSSFVFSEIDDYSLHPGPSQGTYRGRHGRWAGMRWTRGRRARGDRRAVWP